MFVVFFYTNYEWCHSARRIHIEAKMTKIVSMFKKTNNQKKERENNMKNNEVEKGLVKNEMRKTKDSPVRIIGFCGGDWSGHGNDQKKHKMPDNYLDNSELPKPLIELTKKNGWTDEEGNVFFKEDFQPEPYFDEEKNITWILANNKTDRAVIMAMSKESFMKNHSVQ